MLYSMTGFGSASREVAGARYLVEIRSFNNKFLKAQIRLPEELQGLEADIESTVTARLRRGSVVVSVRFSDASPDAAARLNLAALQRCIDELRSLEGVTSIDPGLLLALPGMTIADGAESAVPKARGVLLELVGTACDEVMQMREREGRSLLSDLETHLERIDGHLAVVRKRAPAVIELYQQRLRQRMQSLLADADRTVREEDLLREVAVFAERSDIAEEISRLQGHLEQFGEIIRADRAEPVGRTLDFLSQEMLREANTIASKCLDVEVSRQIVEIKSAIDRIKEQAQNVE